MAMKLSVVWADGTFPSDTAPLVGPLEECARKAAELGYEAMSLTVNRPGELEAERVNRIMKEYGLKVSGLATGRGYSVDGLGLAMADEERRRAAVDRMLAHGELCARLGGAKLIVGSMRGWIRDAGSEEEYEKLFRASMEQLLEQAQRQGTRVTMEVFSLADSDFGCTIAQGAEFIRSFHTPAFCLQLDTAHIHAAREADFAGEILKAGDLLGQMDLSDLGRLAPDGKHFDFPALMEALKKIGYEDYLVMEYRAQPPENAAKAGLDYIRTLL